MIDFIMAAECPSDEMHRSLAANFATTISTIKNRLHEIYSVYGIDRAKYSPNARLVYLRAKELRLL